MKNKNFLTFEKALENAFDNNLNSFKFKGVTYDLEDIDDLTNYKDLEVYQLGGSSKSLWNAQTGGETNNLTIVENGEYIKDNQGKIGKITNIPSHDDNELIIDGESQYVPKGQGGQGTYNVNSVLSATHENRNQSDNTYGKTDEEIKIKPQEALALAEQLNLSIKRPLGSISPSKLMDKLLESREKLVTKYKDIDKPLNFERQANSFVANVDVLKSIPTPEDIYEFLFQNQEDSKSENNEMYAQTGIQIDPAKKGTFKSAATRYGMSMDALATDAKENPEKYSGILRKKANFYRNFVKQTGGNTLYVDSKNDPRYKAYQDSLNLFNSYKNVRKGLEEKGYTPQMSYADKTKIMKFPVNRGLGKEYYDSFQNKENKNIKQINENEYLILDTANNMVNTDLPYQLFNKKIKPSGVTEYKGSEKYMIGSTPDNIKISTKGRGLQLASSVFGGGRDIRPVFEYDNANPKQQVIFKEPIIKNRVNVNTKPRYIQPVRNQIDNLSQIESIPYQEQGVNYQYPDINYQAPESTEFYNPERVIGSEYIRNADGSMGRFQKKKSEYYDKELQEMNKQTGGLRKSQQDLKNWGDQKWRTNSGKKSSETGERYLPDKAWNNLSASEKARTNRAKREGGGTGKNVPQPKDIAEKTSNYRKAQYGLDDEMYYKSGGSTVNSAGNYTKPEMRKRLFNRIKGEASMGTAAGQWSARKAQKLAKAYKDNGGGYRQVGGDETVTIKNPLRKYVG